MGGRNPRSRCIRPTMSTRFAVRVSAETGRRQIRGFWRYNHPVLLSDSDRNTRHCGIQFHSQTECGFVPLFHNRMGQFADLRPAIGPAAAKHRFRNSGICFPAKRSLGSSGNRRRQHTRASGAGSRLLHWCAADLISFRNEVLGSLSAQSAATGLFRRLIREYGRYGSP